ncbi:uncharacterized protein LOC144438534 [Glandiceps talaboti]
MEKVPRRSGLDSIISKLHDSSDTPDTNSKKSVRTGSSKRKPTVTRHVLSSEADENSEDDFVNRPPRGKESEATPTEESENASDVKPPSDDESERENQSEIEEQEIKIEVNADGIPVLPDGTVVVQPEPVPDDGGRSFRESKSRSSASVKSQGSQDGNDVGIVHCCSCGDQVNPSNKSNVRKHPVLNILLCRKCYNYYTSGTITKDDEGIDEQCMLCGEGGKLLCCSFCSSTFCRACIKRVRGRKELSAIDDADEWKCYCCDLEPLSSLRDMCDAIFDNLKGLKNQLKKGKGERRRSVSSQGLGTDSYSEAESITEEVNKLAMDTDKIGRYLKHKDQKSKSKNEPLEIWKRKAIAKGSSSGSGVDNLRLALKDIRAKAKMLQMELEKYESKGQSSSKSAARKSDKHEHKLKGVKDEVEEKPSTSDKKRSRLDIECEMAILDEIKAMQGDDSEDEADGSNSESEAKENEIDDSRKKKFKIKLDFGKKKNENSDKDTCDESIDSDPEIQFPKSPQLKKKTKAKRSESQSSDHDSDLEDEIDCLERNVKNKYKSKKRTRRGDSASDDDEVDKESRGEGGEGKKNVTSGDENRDSDLKENDSEVGEKKARRRKKKDESSSSSSSSSDDDNDEDQKKKTKSDPNATDSDQNVTNTEDNSNFDEFGQSDSDIDGKRKRKQKESISSTEDDSDDQAARKKLMKDIEAGTENDSEDESESSSSSSDEDKGKKKRTKKEKKQTGKKEKESVNSDDSEENITKKKSRRKNRLLNVKISDSESDSEDIGRKKQKRKRKEDSSSSESFSESSSSQDSDSDYSADSLKPRKTRSRRSRRRKSQSDTEDSRKKRSYKKAKGKKRRRIKVASNSSDEEEDSDESGSDTKSTPKGKGRKKIRKLMTEDKLKEETIRAAKEEEERRKRIADRRKEVIRVEDESSPQKCPVTTKLVLECDPDTNEPIVQVQKDLIRHLKPHQVDAVQFLWDSCIESVAKVKKEDGGGCILAHCMGLGKTLSVFAFIHTILTTRKCRMSTCLVVAPLNTVLNWLYECNKWVPERYNVDTTELASVKDNYNRADTLQSWHEEGGIMIMGYDMYRMLAKGTRIRNKRLKRIFHETLVDPGPDVVVCDEGHILKNDASSISETLNSIKTRRRICLTGTPLQNNLIEYHCMVSFVKPNLMGTRKEFSNRFANPISNGQHSDSTAFDVRVMKRRAHVLHDLLSGCVQRKDYTALTKFLPPKHEYVVSVRLCEVQRKLYEHYMNTVSSRGTGTGRGGGSGLFADYQVLMRVWTHPYILRLGTIRDENRAKYYDTDSMDDFINDYDSDEESNDSIINDSSTEVSALEDKLDNENGKGRKTRKKNYDSDSSVEVVNAWKSSTRGKEANGSDEGREKSRFPPPPIERTEWYSDMVKEEDAFNIQLSGKLLLLLEILKLCEEIGDKVLVFSQSLLSLDIIEDFLEYIEKKAEEARDGEEEPDPILQNCGSGAWVKNIDYFRMDGSTSAHHRQNWCNIFNDHANLRGRLFLISTKAGSLGINLVAANRVIIFDASWNPTHDVQSIFRVYRFGQTKACYVYRFLAQGTMEEKIYERQVTKQSLAQRVIDEHQIGRHFTSADLSELYHFTPDIYDPEAEQPTPMLPKDFILAELLKTQKEYILKFHEHDSLLENIVSEELSEEDRKAAWAEYEAEKAGRSTRPPTVTLNPEFAHLVMQQQQQQYLQQQQQQQQQQRQEQSQIFQQLQFQHLQRLLSNGANLLNSGERILQGNQPSSTPGFMQQYLRDEHLRRLQQAQAQAHAGFVSVGQRPTFSGAMGVGQPSSFGSAVPRTGMNTIPSVTVREILSSWRSPTQPGTSDSGSGAQPQTKKIQDGGLIE